MRTVNIGAQGFEELRKNHYFYVDKTSFIQDRYTIRSNRESGYGRYDICLFPNQKGLPGIIMKFKVQDQDSGEDTLECTAENALRQITDKKTLLIFRRTVSARFYSMDSPSPENRS